MATKKTTVRTRRKGTAVRRKSKPDSTAAPLGDLELLEMILRNVQETVTSKELKVTIGDLIRLMQLRREISEETPREVQVSWVEPGAKAESSSEE